MGSIQLVSLSSYIFNDKLMKLCKETIQQKTNSFLEILLYFYIIIYTYLFKNQLCFIDLKTIIKALTVRKRYVTSQFQVKTYI